jgi:hypothetical protein
MPTASGDAAASLKGGSDSHLYHHYIRMWHKHATAHTGGIIARIGMAVAANEQYLSLPAVPAKRIGARNL